MTRLNNAERAFLLLKLNPVRVILQEGVSGINLSSYSRVTLFFIDLAASGFLMFDGWFWFVRGLRGRPKL